MITALLLAFACGFASGAGVAIVLACLRLSGRISRREEKQA